MGAVILWGWDEDAQVYRKVLLDSDGKLRISDADPFEIIQGTPADLKHSPQTYDPVTPAWRPLASNALGHLLIQIASLAELGDIDDVTIAALADGHFISWSEGLGYWQNRLLAETDIPEAIRYSDAKALAAAIAGGLNKIVGLATTYREVSDEGRVASLGYTDLDLTAHTSANAKFAILQLRVGTTAYTDNLAKLTVRKNGETPTYMGEAYHPPITGVPGFKTIQVIVGLDSGQVMEYAITVTPTGTYNSYIDLLGYIE